MVSSDFPLVSFINITKTKPKQQLTARRSVIPCKYIISSKIGNDFAAENIIKLLTTEENTMPAGRIYNENVQLIHYALLLI